MDAAKPEQRPSAETIRFALHQLLTNPLRGWGLSPGLLTPQPVLLQEAVLPFLLKKITGTESSPYLQPTEDPADQQEHSAVRGPEQRGNFPPFSCFPEPGARRRGNTPAEGKYRGSGPLRGRRLEIRCRAVVCFSLPLWNPTVLRADG